MPMLPWPDFSAGFLGKLRTTGGSFGILQSGKAQGEPFLYISGGKFRLWGQGARTQPHGTHASGVYAERDYDPDDPLTNWSDSTGMLAAKALTVAGTPNAEAWDTAGYIKHPVTLESLLYGEARPGTRPSGAGEIGAIQVATSMAPEPGMETVWTKDNTNILTATLPTEAGFINLSGEWAGGIGECTPIWRPSTQKVRLFYESLTNLNAPSGLFDWSVTYADSDDGKTGWVKRPTPFWNPRDETTPAAAWLPYRGAWQPSFAADPTIAGLVWMVTMLSTNQGAKIGIFQSPDGGDTWLSHPNNPVLTDLSPNGPGGEGSLGAPSLCIDATAGVYWLTCDGAPGARGINDLYLAKALRSGEPVEPPPEITTGARVAALLGTDIGAMFYDSAEAVTYRVLGTEPRDIQAVVMRIEPDKRPELRHGKFREAIVFVRNHAVLGVSQPNEAKDTITLMMQTGSEQVTARVSNIIWGNAGAWCLRVTA